MDNLFQFLSARKYFIYPFRTKKFQPRGKERNMYYQNQVQNPPTAAYWVSLIGGILGVLGGLALIGLGAVAGVFSFGLGFVFIGGLGIWILICSAIVIYAAGKLKAEPMQHSKWGAIILVFSIIGGWSILDFIGGILALVYTPIPAGAPQQYQPQPQGYTPQPNYAPQPQANTRVCPQCGRVVPDNVKFCPNCGKQLY
jgi:hypothetical protein